MKIHVYSTLAKLVIKVENPDPIHYTRTIQIRKHTMTRTPGCPALRTGMVGETSFVCLYVQVNEKFFELKKGHIGIVEKAQETSSDSDMHNTVCLCHCSTS